MPTSRYSSYLEWVAAVRNGSCPDNLRTVLKHLAGKIASSFDPVTLSALQNEFNRLSPNDRDIVWAAYAKLPGSQGRQFPLTIPPTPTSSVYRSTIRTPTNFATATSYLPQMPVWLSTPTPVPGLPPPEFPCPQDEYCAVRATYSELSPVARRAMTQSVLQTPTQSTVNGISVNNLLKYPQTPTSQREFLDIFHSGDYLSIVNFSKVFSINMTAFEVLKVSMADFAIDSANLVYVAPHESSAANRRFST
jgi:hypothetical protein